MKIKTKKTLFTCLFLCITAALSAFSRPFVTNIKAEYASGNKINITWTNPSDSEKPVTKYLIYRSTKPLTFFSDINQADFLTQIPGNSTGFTDTVNDLNDYFYAVISFTDECLDLIMPAMNATVSGVHVQAEKQSIKTPGKSNSPSTVRSTPLPYLDLVEGMKENTSQHVISREARQKAIALGSLKKGQKSKPTMDPYFFETDMISPERGDAYYLFQILSLYFAPADYVSSITQLKKLTGRNISKDVENRSIFYLGESYYFTGNYEECVRTLVKVQDVFPEECKKWIESSLNLLEIMPE